MQVTKINENQVRCIINREDILSRNTNLVELFHNRDKMHSLFTDMMEEVSKEYGDDYREEGIMMEAIITMDGSIVVTLTKQSDTALIEESTEKQSDSCIVYSFDNLSMVIEASKLLKNFNGVNTLYKDSLNHRYYLIFSKGKDGKEIEKQIYFLNDYGVEEHLTKVNISYIEEHFDAISTKSAMQTLASIR